MFWFCGARESESAPLRCDKMIRMPISDITKLKASSHRSCPCQPVQVELPLPHSHVLYDPALQSLVARPFLVLRR